MSLLPVVLLGCAQRAMPPAAVEPPPAWSTEEGQEQTRVELVETMLSTGQPEAAIHLLNEMSASGVSSPKLTMLHARALRQIGLAEDAEIMLEELTRRHRRMPEAYNELGILAMDLSEPDTAIPHFERACKLDKESPEYSNNLGFALMAAGRPAEAVDVLREALKHDATRLRTRNNLGFALVADGREQEAYRVFRSAIPEDQARYNLGVGLELRGDLDRAAEAYRAALTNNPDNSRAREALTRLALPSPDTQPQENP